jgi:hypothetical protein
LGPVPSIQHLLPDQPLHRRAAQGGTLNQLWPLVEFSFDTPRGQNTAATVNPGLAYVAVTWQLAGEVIVPMNREGGGSAGFRAQLLFFLDDLIPTIFDKPLLSDKPKRDELSWH